MKPPFPNSYWLVPNVILCGEYPRRFEDFEEHDSMNAILGAGVLTFIDLTEAGELKPYREIAERSAARLGLAAGDLEFYRFPIRDTSVPTSPGEMRAILRQLDAATAMGRVCYVHCWGGRGRTGTVAACFLSEWLQCDGSKALDELQLRWRHCAKSAYAESPETPPQLQFVRNWTRCGEWFQGISQPGSRSID